MHDWLLNFEDLLQPRWLLTILLLLHYVTGFAKRSSTPIHFYDLKEYNLVLEKALSLKLLQCLTLC